MKTLVTLFSAVSLLAIFQFQLFVWAAPSGQYSINIHFVPPILNANCTAARFWQPTNIRCAQCFCMTGQISRCIPRAGCNPTEADNSTTTARPGDSTTVDPAATTTAPPPPPAPVPVTQAPAPAPAPGPVPVTTAAPAATTAAPAPAPASTAAPAADSTTAAG